MSRDIYHTIIRPIITEKSTKSAARSSKHRGAGYCFEVALDANKSDIRDAVEKIYNVKVVSVNTMNNEGKRRRFRFRYGKTHPTKKAVVYVDSNSAIDMF